MATFNVDFSGAAGAPAGWTQRGGTNVVQDGTGVAEPAAGGAMAIATLDAADGSLEQDVTWTFSAPGTTGGYHGGATRCSGTGGTFAGYTHDAQLGSASIPVNDWSGGAYNSTLHSFAIGGGQIVQSGDQGRITVDASGATPLFTCYFRKAAGSWTNLGTYSVPSGGRTGTAVGVALYSDGAAGDVGIDDVAIVTPTTAEIEQEGFRWRNDDGDEDGATWAAEQDTGISAPVSENRRLRVLLNATGDPASTQLQLEYRIAAGAYAKVLAAQPTAATPVPQAMGTAVNGTGALSPTWPTHQAGDVALLVVESAGGEAVTLTTSAGFAAVTNSPQATGAGTAGTRLSVFWCRATSGAMGAPTVGDSGDHQYARIFTFRGVRSTGDPWDVTAGDVKAAASTSLTWPSVTTTVDKALMVLIASRDNDATAAAFSNYTNAGITGLAEWTGADSGTTAGNGGGITVATGEKTAAGAVGTTTATVTSSVNAMLTIALAPEPATQHPILLSPSANIAASGEATTAQLTAPSGKTTSDFTVGRIQDDENPADAIDLSADDYTELEWCLAAVSGVASASDVYEFRVTKAGVALDTYTVTPEWTIASAGGGVVVSEPVAAVEDEVGAGAPWVRVFSAAAALEDEVVPEPVDTTIYVNAVADAVEDEVGAVATGGPVESEPVPAVEDEVAAIAAHVRVASVVAAVESEAGAAAASVRVFTTAAAVEDEVARATVPSQQFGEAAGVEDEVAAVTARVRIYGSAAALEDESGAAPAWARVYSTAAALEREAGVLAVSRVRVASHVAAIEDEVAGATTAPTTFYLTARRVTLVPALSASVALVPALTAAVALNPEE